MATTAVTSISSSMPGFSLIQPFPTDPEHDFTRVTGTPKVGQTLTCTPPQFGGSPATLSYRWIFNFKTISRSQTIVATKR